MEELDSFLRQQKSHLSYVPIDLGVSRFCVSVHVYMDPGTRFQDSLWYGTTISPCAIPDIGGRRANGSRPLTSVVSF
jgi:hypothetical protein